MLLSILKYIPVFIKCQDYKALLWNDKREEKWNNDNVAVIGLNIFLRETPEHKAHDYSF